MSAAPPLVLSRPKARPWRALIVNLLAIALGVALFWVVLNYDMPLRRFAAIVATASMLLGAFFLLYSMVTAALGPRSTVCAVARAVLLEAIQMKIALALLVALLAIIAAAPFVVGEGDKLQYRIQQFLTYTLSLSSLLIAAVTIFVGCATLTREIEDKQIFTVMSKPVRRGPYLLGKWLGLVLLSGLLLSVAALAIYVFAVFFLQRQPAMDQLDRVAIRSELFTARIAAEPRPPDAVMNRIQQQATERLEALKQNQGELYIQEQGGEQTVLDSYMKDAITEWRSMGPWNQGKDKAVFVFDRMLAARQQARRAFERQMDQALAELEPAVRQRMQSDSEFNRYVRGRLSQAINTAGFDGQYVQLEYKLRATGQTPDDHVRVRLGANGRWLGDPMQAPQNIRQTLPIPAEWISEQGRLEVLVHNYNPQASISLPTREGMSLLYKVDTFTPNYVRAVLIIWLKLVFIAALALAAGTFLGFPVAVLLTMLVTISAASSGYILESLNYYAADTGQGVSLVTLSIKYLAMGFTKPLEQFSTLRSIEPLVEGRYVAWAHVGRAAVWIGGLWTALAGVVGYLVYQRKELARVQV